MCLLPHSHAERSERRAQPQVTIVNQEVDGWVEPPLAYTPSVAVMNMLFSAREPEIETTNVKSDQWVTEKRCNDLLCGRDSGAPR